MAKTNPPFDYKCLCSKIACDRFKKIWEAKPCEIEKQQQNQQK